jgi:hypothetical protein
VANPTLPQPVSNPQKDLLRAAKANTVVAGLLQRGTPGMDGVPGVSQVWR